MEIVCGPIIRNATREQLHIWIVTLDTARNIDVALYRKDGNRSIPSNTTHKTVALGTHCFVTLISVSFQLSNTCERVSYDIQFDGRGFRDTGFNKVISLGNDELPSLALPHSHRHFIQMSCRKPHDSEGVDQVEGAAKHVQRLRNDSNRPSQLYMTGDQIYADDVSPLLTYSFREVRRTLGLTGETLITGRGRSYDPEQEYIDVRDEVLPASGGFTSGAKDSHLLTFSDYLSMYLFAFGGMLPGQEWASYRELKKSLSYEEVEDYLGDTKLEYTFQSRHYRKHKQVLTLFAETTRTRMRPLLANIATYMIFDDHEVTDDWNLTQNNQKNLRTHIMGRQVYVNALSAYLICQHWGNQPKSVSESQLKAVELMAAEPTPDNHRPLESLADQYWGYIIDQTPPVVVLDTRTKRVFSGNRLALMSSSRIADVGKKLANLPSCPTLILISPTPVYGFTAAEVMQLSRFGERAKTFVDREPWIASKKAIKQLQVAVSRLPGVEDIIILSGDVHYAFSRRQVLEDNEVTFWQFCSSATCNTAVGGKFGITRLRKFIRAFQKKRTPYLIPSRTDKEVVFCDKNIGTIELSTELVPMKATLFTRRKGGREKKRSYDLTKPSELN